MINRKISLSSPQVLKLICYIYYFSKLLGFMFTKENREVEEYNKLKIESLQRIPEDKICRQTSIIQHDLLQSLSMITK